MSSLRRFVAALSGALLLQLVLLGSGTLCGMHGVGMPAMPGHGSQSMHAMHAASAKASGAQISHAPLSSHRCDASSEGDDCRSPWSPGQCASMATCTSVTAAVALIAAVDVGSPVAPDLPDPVAIHSGPAAAPELPPPRV